MWHLRPGRQWNASQARIQSEFDSAPGGCIILAGDSHAAYTPSRPFPRPVLNAGIGGATAKAYSRTIKAIRAPLPAFLSILIIGTNDIRSASALSKASVDDFSRNVTLTIRQLQYWSQNVVVVALPPTPISKIREREPLAVEVYTVVLRSISNDIGANFFDPFLDKRAERFGLSLDDHFIDGTHFHEYHKFACNLASYLRKNFRCECLFNSVLPGFDEEYYTNWYPDTIEYPYGPARHYIDIGWLEGRDPSGFFSTDGYLLENPDVANDAINPLIHFLESGFAQGRTGWQKSCAKPTHHGFTERNPFLVKNQKIVLDERLKIR